MLCQLPGFNWLSISRMARRAASGSLRQVPSACRAGMRRRSFQPKALPAPASVLSRQASKSAVICSHGVARSQPVAACEFSASRSRSTASQPTAAGQRQRQVDTDRIGDEQPLAQAREIGGTDAARSIDANRRFADCRQQRAEIHRQRVEGPESARRFGRRRKRRWRYFSRGGVGFRQQIERDVDVLGRPVAEIGEAAEDQAAIPELLSAVLRLEPHSLTFQPGRADRSERTVAAREDRRLHAAAGGTQRGPRSLPGL